MIVTIKLSRKLGQALALRCAEGGVSKSDVVRTALAEYLSRKPASAYELGKGLFGRHGGGGGNLSVQRHMRFVELVDVKRRRSSGRMIADLIGSVGRLPSDLSARKKRFQRHIGTGGKLRK
jgi:hypothetical protein